MPATAIRAFVARCPNVRNISLRGSSHVDDALLCHVLATLPFLLSLDVSHCPQLTTASLVALRNFGNASSNGGNRGNRLMPLGVLPTLIQVAYARV